MNEARWLHATKTLWILVIGTLHLGSVIKRSGGVYAPVSGHQGAVPYFEEKKSFDEAKKEVERHLGLTDCMVVG